MRRITILIGAMAALMLVPAAQAFATPSLKVNVTGSGSGEVVTNTSTGWSGTPTMACSYNGASQGGTCQNTPDEFAEGKNHEWLVANPAPGSEFGGWLVQKGEEHNFTEFGCEPNFTCEGFTEFCPGGQSVAENTGFAATLLECGFASNEGGEPNEWEVQATFCAEGTAKEEEKENAYWEVNEMMLVGCSAPTGPELTVTKEGGSGTVVSNPAGIECGATCNAAFAENSKVTLTASPASGFVFKSWKGCEKGGAIGHTCTVTMDKAKTVVAKFGPVQSLTVGKAGSGTGSVKSSPTGIACDLNCSSNVAAFTEGASVVLTAVPTKYHTFTGWSGSGCSGTGTCTVTMSAAKSVTAEFAATKFNLTLSKAGGGTGATKSKPASLTCGATCSTVVSSFYAGTEVEVTATPSKGSTLNWSVGSGTCTGSTSPCKVTMSSAKSLTAEFK